MDCRRSDRSSYEPREVEETDRVVHRLNLEDAGEAIKERRQGVARRRRFGACQLLGEARPRIDEARSERVRAVERDVGGHDNHLLGAGCRDFLEQPDHGGGPVADAMRLTAPERRGRKSDEMRLGEERDRQRRRYGVGDGDRARRREIHDLRAPLTARTRPEEPGRAVRDRRSANTRSRRVSRSCVAISSSR